MLESAKASAGTTTVMEVKLHYFHGRGSDTAVAEIFFSLIADGIWQF